MSAPRCTQMRLTRCLNVARDDSGRCGEHQHGAPIILLGNTMSRPICSGVSARLGYPFDAQVGVNVHLTSRLRIAVEALEAIDGAHGVGAQYMANLAREALRLIGAP